MTVELPNIRKLFIPDTGKVMYDADLTGADAQVVAAEAEDNDLLAAFRAGLDVHEKNATDLWGTAFTSLTGTKRKTRRKETKQAVHATNYGAHARTISAATGWSLHEAEDFQRRWLKLHPGIRDWHSRVQAELSRSRTATNRFGYRIVYFDRIDSLLPQALAWVPQSTVALTCFRGALQLERTLPYVEILLQVHDSLVFQIPQEKENETEEIRSALRNPIPYAPTPLTIEWKLSRSKVSWGDCEEIKAA